MAKVTPIKCNTVVDSKHKEEKPMWPRALLNVQFSLHLENDSAQVWIPKLAELFKPKGVRPLPRALSSSKRQCQAASWFHLLRFYLFSLQT